MISSVIDAIRQHPFRRTWQRILMRVVAPAALFLWPFTGLRQGVNISDATYSMTNFAYQDHLDPMWLLATYIPNLLGRFFFFLPGGDTMAGMRAWCTLLISLTALLVWFMAGSLRGTDAPGTHLFPAPLLFLGLWIAESLCWCPPEILYNTLTYFFLTAMALFLLLAFNCGEERRARLFYFAAGICGGINLFVRFPNAVEVLLILAVFYHALFAPAKERLRQLLTDTGVCVAGYVTGVIIPIVIISIRYGFGAYIEMIGSLFSMTGGAADYTPAGMIAAILGAYKTTLLELLPVIPVLAAGAGLALGFRRLPSLRVLWLSLYAFCLAVLYRWYMAKGVITGNYWYYDCMFEPAMMVIVLSVALSAVVLAGAADAAPFLRSAAVLSLLLILITPLGSNNYTYPVINNLFVVLPVTLVMLKQVLEKLAKAGNAAELFHLPFLAWSVLVIGVLLVQGTLFHVRFAFGDGTDGAPRDAVMTALPRAEGMVTTGDNAAAIEALYRDLHEKHGDALVAADNRAVIFGNAPGLHFLLELEPAIFTAWPDLASNETDRVRAALDETADDRQSPLVILHMEQGEDQQTFSTGEGKRAIILDYLDKNGYNMIFEENGGTTGIYRVFARPLPGETYE